MWIRSQDKESLVNCEVFGLLKNIKIDEIGGYSIINERGYSLGDYSSKEQALKVLDLIQKELDKECLKPFQMPVNNGVWRYE